MPKSSGSYEEESASDEEEAPAQKKKAKKDRLSNKAKDLLPLESKTRTSRFDRPSASTSKLSADEEDVQDDDTSDDDEAESEDAKDDEGDDFDNEWARTGGYHVSKREIARMEEQAAAQGGKFNADEEAEQREALELYEARRIQKESKDKLDETDYIDLEELEDADAKEDDLLALSRVDRQQQKISQAPQFDSREEAIAHLLAREPELLALLDDFSACTAKLPLVQQAVKLLHETPDNERKLGLGYLYRGRGVKRPFFGHLLM